MKGFKKNKSSVIIPAQIEIDEDLLNEKLKLMDNIMRN